MKPDSYSHYLVPFKHRFSIADAPTSPPRKAPSKKECKAQLKAVVEEIEALQRVLYADDRFSLLVMFQAMDAAGKDGTIRAVFSGVNPAGFQVNSFKQPSTEDLDHDFLWRTSKCLPERGRIGVFNRSYYEEVLVVRVHPEYLKNQRIKVPSKLDNLWAERFESIRDHEAHLARNGTVVIKFFLNVSRDEQRNRFLSRLNEPEKHWKFSESDVRERRLWKKYMKAYEDALNQTSRPHAPWYAIPADNKPFMRLEVAKVILAHLKSLPISYPKVDSEKRRQFGRYKSLLDKDN